jgi:hypothetical protein
VADQGRWIGTQARVLDGIDRMDYDGPVSGRRAAGDPATALAWRDRLMPGARSGR